MVNTLLPSFILYDPFLYIATIAHIDYILPMPTWRSAYLHEIQKDIDLLADVQQLAHELSLL